MRSGNCSRMVMDGVGAMGVRGFASMSRLLMAGIICASFPVLACAQQSSVNTAGEPLAIFEGQPIVETELPVKEQAQLQRMLQQVYGVRLRALHQVLDRRLFEAEAKRRGISPDDLLKIEVISKVPQPSEDQVKTYYDQHQANFKGSYEEEKDRISSGLYGVEVQKAENAYAQGLLQQALNSGELQMLITPPKVEVSADPARIRGDANAPVTIVEFSDFSCTFCRSAEGTIGELLAKYPGKVKIAYRDFPLPQLHPNAELAAEASRCAGEQGRYWDYHDTLFAHYTKQTREDLVGYAREMKLDDKKFDACLTSGRYKQQVEQDVQLGARSGVMATPGFFVNGRFLSGAQPAAVFEKVIEEELAAPRPKVAAETQQPAGKEALAAVTH